MTSGGVSLLPTAIIRLLFSVEVDCSLAVKLWRLIPLGIDVIWRLFLNPWVWKEAAASYCVGFHCCWAPHKQQTASITAPKITVEIPAAWIPPECPSTMRRLICQAQLCNIIYFHQIHHWQEITAVRNPQCGFLSAYSLWEHKGATLREDVMMISETRTRQNGKSHGSGMQS